MPGSLELYSEPFQPIGSIDARASRRAIGRPTLDHWSVFLRETLQNSWDARTNKRGSIHFSVDAWWATEVQRRLLREEIFLQEPPDLGLREALTEGDLGLLLVTDSGTRGLTGPTRADVAADESDFVDLVRNIGRDESKGIAGGTYGFGKAVLYNASACATVLIFTRTHVAGRAVSRLIAMAVGASYTRNRRRFTGRHWWGVPDDTTGVEPLTGRAAETLAARLGIETLPNGATGTAILVIAPIAYEEEYLEEIVERIAGAATWYAWPHMVKVGRLGPSIRFSFSYDGKPHRPPDPEVHPILKHYTAGYRLATDVLAGESLDVQWPWTVSAMKSERPIRRLGVLAHRLYEAPSLSAESEGAPGDLTSHVALMRNPRFVVRYMEVPRDPNGLAMAGVFIGDPELDAEFAAAEPVAHDDWSPRYLQLEKFERNPVRQALDRIRHAFRTGALHGNPDEGAGGFRGLTKVSSLLGDLLTGQLGGTDARTPADPHGGGEVGISGRTNVGGGRDGTQTDGKGVGESSGRRGFKSPPRIELAERPRLLVTDAGAMASEFDFDLVWTRDSNPVRIAASPRVVIDGNHLEDPDEAPVGAERPTVMGWRNRETNDLLAGPTIRIAPADGTQWSIRISQPLDTAVSVILTSDAETEG